MKTPGRTLRSGGIRGSHLTRWIFVGPAMLVVICLLNTGDKESPVRIDLSAFGSSAKKASLYRTSQQENCKRLKNIAVRKQQIDYTMPAQSITTLILTSKKPLM